MCLVILILALFLLNLLLLSFLIPLPVNDSGLTRYRTVPWVTLLLIIVNTVIFVLWIAPDIYSQTETDQSVLDANFERYVSKVNRYGYSEWNLRRGVGIGAFATFSHMFMHADFWHLFGNMIYLWTFGRRVEDACGSWRFLIFYLLVGMLAAVGFALLDPSLNVGPGVGASGAISGVMGAYLLLFPSAKVNCLWGIGSLARLPYAAIRLLWNSEQKLWKWTITFRAWILLILYVIYNMIPSLQIMQNSREVGGVGYLAHLSGLLAALTVFLFVRKDLLVRYVHGRAL
jgi:membrane associated rhomboid family serine protease